MRRRLHGVECVGGVVGCVKSLRVDGSVNGAC